MTMRRLLLFRHAKAEQSEPGMEDRARKLMERGWKDAAKVGAYMASHGLIPDQVITSPSSRTLETWKSAATAFRSPPGAAVVERLYDATAQLILTSSKDAVPSTHTLLVVGHNPGLHDLAVMLIASGDVQARERLRKSSLPPGSLSSISPLTIGASCIRNAAGSNASSPRNPGSAAS